MEENSFKSGKNDGGDSVKIEIENNKHFPRPLKPPKPLTIRIFTRIVYLVSVTIAFLVALVLLPILLLILSPFYLLRYVVFKTGKFFGPDLGKMMSSRSSIIGVDTIYDQPQCVLVGKLVAEGKLDFDTFLADLQSKWIEAKAADDSPKYPELTQYVTRRFGLYLFWKNEDNFKLTDHVKLFDRSKKGQSETDHENSGGVIKNDDGDGQLSNVQLNDHFETDESVNELMAQCVPKNFHSQKSPWEIILIQNYKSQDTGATGTDTAIIIRWHHSLMDGLSTFKLLSQFTNLSMDTVPRPKNSQNKKVNCWTKFWSTLSFIYRVPYEAIEASIESLDKNPWHLSETKLTRNSHFKLSEKIPVDQFHAIKSYFQVSFSTVIFAALTATLKKFMETSKPNEPLPKIIHAGLPFPYPGGGHPPKLRNHMSLCTAKLPVGIGDPVERLYWIEDHLNELRNSTIPFMSFHIMPFLGSLPIPILRQLVKNDNTTCMFSHMPGPTSKFQNLHGQKFTEWCFTSGHGPGSVGISIFCLSYGGTLTFSTVVDDALVSNSDLSEQLAAGVVDEITKLAKFLISSPPPDTETTEQRSFS